MLRRGRLVVLALAVGAATTFAALPGQAETLRSGLARAQLAKIVPYVGIPSVGAGAGVAQAEISGGSAHASAGGAPLRAVATVLRGGGAEGARPPPRLPSPLPAPAPRHPPPT